MPAQLARRHLDIPITLFAFAWPHNGDPTSPQVSFVLFYKLLHGFSIHFINFNLISAVNGTTLNAAVAPAQCGPVRRACAVWWNIVLAERDFRVTGIQWVPWPSSRYMELNTINNSLQVEMVLERLISVGLAD